MNFDWTETQERLARETLDFARSELGSDTVARDAAGDFDRALWRRAADHGVLRWAVPKEHGGDGLDLLTVVRRMEALGEGCRDNGLTFALGAQVWGVQTALLHFGSAEQIARVLPGSMDGTLLAAYCMTEEGSGSDAFALQTTATRTDHGWVLDGEKVLITLGPIADVAIVFAATDPSAGRWGLSAFLVEADRPGYVAQPVEAKMGLRTVPFGRVTLEGCEVPESALIGKEGAGASLFTFSQGWERSLVLAPQLGAMQRQLNACVAFARERKRGGRSIGKYQAIAHRIADMKLRLETCRLLLYRTAWLQQNGRPNLMEAALTKTYLGECFQASSTDAILVHGGDGYRTDTEVERDLRDAIGGLIYGGTTDVQRNIVAGLLGL